ncbi:Rieske (2Fe-2S) protein, partial [Tamlana crocina]|uniref:Rieske (2Fe-2S) protein n=1 Tax=Tamlana crocina TaxID=393006 RepID=UPI001ADDD6E6
FSVNFDLSLPEYNQLNFPGNKFVTRNYGINGIVIFNLNNDQYMAFELTDPNHVPQACSPLIVEGTEAVCSCGDGNKYNIITGQRIAGEGEYSLKPYRVERV